jgi:hypothetical protein
VLLCCTKARCASCEAAAADKAWGNLIKCPVKDLGLEDGDETKKALRNVIMESLQCFSELLEQIKGMEAEHSVNTYAWETMSESLVRFSCMLIVHVLSDPSFMSRK